MMTTHRNTPNRLRHGQALALQYAAQILINVNRGGPQIIQGVLSPAQLGAENAVKTATLGCRHAARIMLPFIVELALKALIARHGNDQAQRTHRLTRLYDALPVKLENKLNCDFETVKRSDIPGETRSLREILLDHDNDFHDWRYLDDPENLLVDSIYTLQFVACSVLNIYNNN